MHGKVKACPLVTEAGNASPAILAERIYINVLSRPPTEKELTKITAYADSTSTSSRELAEDLVWALMNQPEFIYIH